MTTPLASFCESLFNDIFARRGVIPLAQAKSFEDLAHVRALVHGNRLERMPVSDGAVYAVTPLRWTDFGRARASIRLRTAQPMATSVCRA